MVGLTTLWLPVLLSAVLVFIASSIIHTLLNYHWTDWDKIPGEDNVLEAAQIRVRVFESVTVVEQQLEVEPLGCCLVELKPARGLLSVALLEFAKTANSGPPLAFGNALLSASLKRTVASRAALPGNSEVSEAFRFPPL